MDKNVRILIERAGNGVIVRPFRGENCVASDFDNLVFSFVEEVDAEVAIPSLVEFIESHFTVPRPVAKKATSDVSFQYGEDGQF